MTLFTRFLKDESGATAIEYALIAAIIGIGLIVGLTQLNTEIQAAYTRIKNGLATAGVAAEGG